MLERERGGGISLLLSMVVKKNDFLADNILVKFEGCLLHQTLAIPMEMNVLHSLLTCFFTHMKVHFCRQSG